MVILSKPLLRNRHENVFEIMVTFAPVSEYIGCLQIISD